MLTTSSLVPAQHEHDWRVVAVDYDGFQQVTEMTCTGCTGTLFV